MTMTRWLRNAAQATLMAGALLAGHPDGSVAQTAETAAPAAQADVVLRQDAARVFGWMPPLAPINPVEVELGRALFWDPAISGDGRTACASCHKAASWGADSAPTAPSVNGAVPARNVLTVFNATGNAPLGWLGEYKTVSEIAEVKLVTHLGFQNRQAVMDRLRQRGFDSAFRAAYPQSPNPVSTINYARAIGAYVGTLVTPAPFDRFMWGDDAAITAEAKAGLRAFITVGCAGCHGGPMVGGASYHKAGRAKDFWAAIGQQPDDIGRAALTHADADKYVFRVPSLRNVARTGPYFHDGVMESLDRAVEIMADVQLGTTLDTPTTAAIVGFLMSLGGEVPAHFAPPTRQVRPR